MVPFNNKFKFLMMKEGLLMKKNKTKKILATCLTLTLLLGGTIIVHATSVHDGVVEVFDGDGSPSSYGTQVSPYITGEVNGTIREDHWYNSGCNRSFMTYNIKLERRTPPMQPNEVIDTSTHIDGYNQGVCINGSQYRSVYGVGGGMGFTRINYRYQNW